jgi:SNF2 family DNA or RNA helicase
MKHIALRTVKRSAAWRSSNYTPIGKLALTGTPYDKNPSDIHSILQWLAPDFFTSYWRFFNTHVNSELVVVKKEKRDNQGNVIEAAVTVQQVCKQPLKDATNFARTLRPFMIQRKKEDVRSDLPAKIEQYIDLEMNKKQAQLYYTIKDAPDPVVTLAEGVQTSVSIILTRILREIQVTTDPSLLGLTDVPSVKLEWLRMAYG